MNEELDRKLAERLEPKATLPENPGLGPSPSGCWEVAATVTPFMWRPKAFSSDLDAAHLLGERLKEMKMEEPYAAELHRRLCEVWRTPADRVGFSYLGAIFVGAQAPARLRAEAALAVLEGRRP